MATNQQLTDQVLALGKELENLKAEVMQLRSAQSGGSGKGDSAVQVIPRKQLFSRPLRRGHELGGLA